LYEEIIYALLALWGSLIYVFIGWKRSGEPFNEVKMYDTLVKGGLISIIVAAAALAPAGYSFLPMMTAFWMGLTFDAGIRAVSKVVVPAEPTPAPAPTVIIKEVAAGSACPYVADKEKIQFKP
jgi:fatty acid desaturase